MERIILTLQVLKFAVLVRFLVKNVQKLCFVLNVNLAIINYLIPEELNLLV